MPCFVAACATDALADIGADEEAVGERRGPMGRAPAPSAGAARAEGRASTRARSSVATAAPSRPRVVRARRRSERGRDEEAATCCGIESPGERARRAGRKRPNPAFSVRGAALLLLEPGSCCVVRGLGRPISVAQANELIRRDSLRPLMVDGVSRPGWWCTTWLCGDRGRRRAGSATSPAPCP